MKSKFTFLFSVLISLLFSKTMQAQSVPTPAHVVVVVLENHGYNLIIGSANAPYINSLVADTFGALFTNSHGNTHPSQPNYMYLFSGDNQNVILDFTPLSFLLPFTSANLGAELLQNGKTFTGYSEDLPSVGFTGDSTGGYYRKHNPWVNWQDGTTNGIPAALNQPFTSFPTNFNNLPTLSFVVPNEDHDMHNGTVAQGDAWLQANIDSYAQWAKANNSLLIITFDEDENLLGSNQIPTIFVGQMVKHGQYNENIDHNRVLRTMEDMYSLPNAGASSGSTPITDCWVYKPVSALSASPLGICPGQTISYNDLSTNLPSTRTWSFPGGNPASASGLTPTVTYNTAGVYDVTLVTANQMGADTLLLPAYITVHPNPVLTLNADSMAICLGDTATVTATGAGLYNWFAAPALLYANGGIMKANPATDVVYRVVGSAFGCLSDTAQVSIHVDSVLVPSLQVFPAADTTVCAGAVLTFTAASIGGGNSPFYQWKVNGNNTGTNAPTLGTFAVSGTYAVRCVFTSSATCATPSTLTSPVVNVTVSQLPHPQITAVDSALSCNSAAAYQWYFNGQPISGATAQNYTADTSGVYQAEAFNADGCSALSNPVTVTLALTGMQNVPAGLLNFSLYPNPVSRMLHIDLGETVTNALVQVYNLEGALVLEKLTGNKAVLDWQTFAPGLYLLKISAANSTAFAKVIKQ